MCRNWRFSAWVTAGLLMAAGPASGQVPTDVSYAVDADTHELIRFPLGSPGTVTVIGPTGLSGPLSGDFGPDDQHLYLLEGSEAGLLHVVDTANAAVTTLGALATVHPDERWTAMAWDETRSTMWAATSDSSTSTGNDRLYTVDLDTLVATPVGETVIGAVSSMAVACDGTLYAIMADEALYVRLDPLNGTPTAISQAGLFQTMIQSMDTTINGSFVLVVNSFTPGVVEVRRIDPATGEMVLAGFHLANHLSVLALPGRCDMCPNRVRDGGF